MHVMMDDSMFDDDARCRNEGAKKCAKPRTVIWSAKNLIYEWGGGTQLVEGMGMCRPYGWVLGPIFSKQGSLFRQIFLKTLMGYPEIWRQIVKNG